MEHTFGFGHQLEERYKATTTETCFNIAQPRKIHHVYNL